jgi:hypothetical protein
VTYARCKQRGARCKMRGALRNVLVVPYAGPGLSGKRAHTLSSASDREALVRQFERWHGQDRTIGFLRAGLMADRRASVRVRVSAVQWATAEWRACK